MGARPYTTLRKYATSGLERDFSCVWIVDGRVSELRHARPVLVLMQSPDFGIFMDTV